jgi:hypothetical protein
MRKKIRKGKAKFRLNCAGLQFPFIVYSVLKLAGNAGRPESSPDTFKMK